ncbi:hypothetical protein ACFQ4C_17965 [Larkinella insperata]|uniref:Uncharacterized protein n=1 Tax=Larkinella insperata TaxID=332158 RepID=A0ABW3Q624_9BACT|nr:hypothetical protein [Larkinella insperata]
MLRRVEHHEKVRVRAGTGIEHLEKHLVTTWTLFGLPVYIYHKVLTTNF